MAGTMGTRKQTFDNYTVWCDFSADTETIVDVIDLLVRDLPVSIDALLGGVERGDHVAVARAAHKVVGAAGTVAADPICLVAHQIEAHAKHGSVEAVRPLCQPIAEARDQLIADLLAWRSEIAPVFTADSQCRS